MALRGETGYAATYAKQFGPKLWKKLDRALRKPPTQVCLVNPFLDAEGKQKVAARLGVVLAGGRLSGAGASASSTAPAPLAADGVSAAAGAAGVAEGAGAAEAAGAGGGGEKAKSAARTEATASTVAQIHETLLAASELDPRGADGQEPKPLLSRISLLQTSVGVRRDALLGQKEKDALLVERCKQRAGAAGGAADGEAADLEEAELVAENLFPILDHCFLDGAAVAAALALCRDVARPGEKVLDLCAAPGGKSCLLAAHLFSEEFLSVKGSVKKKKQVFPHLFCNEVSKPGFLKLKKNVTLFLAAKTREDTKNVTRNLLGGEEPSEAEQAASAQRGAIIHDPFVVGDHVTFSNLDACSQAGVQTLWRTAPYDRILVDAPCTPDRQLLGDKREMTHWSGSVPKQAAERQLKLLWTAIWLLRDGGTIVYATGALSDAENGGVVAKLQDKLRKKKELGLEVELTGERAVLPGVEGGHSGACNFGPAYFCRIVKVRGPLGVPPRM